MGMPVDSAGHHKVLPHGLHHAALTRHVGFIALRMDDEGAAFGPCGGGLLWQNGPCTCGDEAIGLGPTVLGKVENGVFVDAPHVEVAFRGDDFIFDANGLRHNLSAWGNDDRLAAHL